MYNYPTLEHTYTQNCVKTSSICNFNTVGATVLKLHAGLKGHFWEMTSGRLRQVPSFSRFNVNEEIFILALLHRSINNNCNDGVHGESEMVNAQLGLLNKQFILIFNVRLNSISLSTNLEQNIFC